ncbi:MAG: 4-hydroxy-tetrahydrodipicolinate synthase [Lachnospiraceae bacterium]|nr:4-hydroxy-tetrahydrodipicolinate synthase [uncultured Acetatifactor sp.]MCI8286392.1 4-hydroxy-tetrahydrodipicolinate synthase [Lachnospiraceae bacterium]
MSIFKGSGVAIVTPMRDNGEVDYERFAKQLKFQIENGTDAIIVCGTTGEASTLSHEEHLEVIRYCVKTVAGRIPVIAGTGSNCTETAIYLSREAETAGADGLLLVSPYYNKATQNGLYGHFRAVAEAVKLPILLYNIPGRTGCNIQPETIVRLCRDVENIVGVKEASGDIAQITRLAALARGCVDIYSGNDNEIVPIMSVGGLGVISVLANIAPAQTHEMCQRFLDGDVKGSCAMQLEAAELCAALFSEVNPIPVKKALELMGMDTGTLRRPLTEMEPVHVEYLKKTMKEYGIL